jgi:hypothetical protein
MSASQEDSPPLTERDRRWNELTDLIVKDFQSWQHPPIPVLNPDRQNLRLSVLPDCKESFSRQYAEDTLLNTATEQLVRDFVSGYRKHGPVELVSGL